SAGHRDAPPTVIKNVGSTHCGLRAVRIKEQELLFHTNKKRRRFGEGYTTHHPCLPEIRPCESDKSPSTIWWIRRTTDVRAALGRGCLGAQEHMDDVFWLDVNWDQ